MYLMWLWCWIITIAGDPGRTSDDLDKRGLLNRIENGDIPNSLHNIPICPECHLPRPRRAYHCEDCGNCHLRFDHHCVFTGQCIADKNFKAFILSFFYAAILGFTIGIPSLLLFLRLDNPYPILSLVLGFYSPLLSIMLFTFGIIFFNGGADSLAVIDQIGNKNNANSKIRLFSTFGNKWWQKIIPYQPHTTEFAWPGVNWDDDSPVL